MIPARVAKRLWDARDATLKALRFTATLDLHGFRASDLTRAAVERQFEIIGEALNAARRDRPDLGHEVPALARWIGLRNLLAHRYDDIRPDTLFLIVQEELPALAETLSALLDAAEPP